jgi:hypothetical protein
MKYTISCLMVMGWLTFLPLAAWSGDDGLLEVDRMVGVQGPFLGNANPIRDVPGGGLPWVLDEAKVELESDGQLEVEVEGLIIPLSSGFGNNPVPFFRAIVSCLSVDQTGIVETVNVITTNGADVMIGDARNGDAKIEEDVDLPEFCIAPVVFVTSPNGSWFSVTGFQ